MMNHPHDPLQGKTTLGKPSTPVGRPRRRPLFVLSRVMLGLFFVLVASAVLFVLLNRAYYKPPLSCGLFACGALSGFLFGTALNNRLYCKEHTRGRIVDIRRQINRRAPDTFVPRIEYTVEGALFFIWGTGSRKPPRLHSDIPVFYDPADPSSATVHIASLPVTVATALFAVGFTVGGILVLCL